MTESSRPYTVLVVDDERSVRQSVIGFLEDERYRALGSESGPEGLSRLEADQIDVVLLDVLMKDMDGLEVLERVKERWPSIPVVMMSGHGSIDLAVRATRRGAYEFLEKPLFPEKLAITIRRALDHSANLRTQALLRAELGASHAIVGECPPIQELLRDIARVAATDGRVMISGENGTGKELVARAIHEGSPRRDGPFVRLNSAAIPRDLVESEIFGYEKGAFTGAAARKLGKLELADRGSLFLDEIGDMDPGAQAKLLRALETGELERLGGTKSIAFDVRVITATNKDLKHEIAEGRFREDLYYRLAVVPLHVPPLRERGDDIVILAHHFLRHFAQDLSRPAKSLTDEAVGLLRRHRWPGNVRELRNLIERLTIMVDGEAIGSGDLAPLLESDGRPGTDAAADEPAIRPRVGTLREQLDAEERDIVLATLHDTGWNVSESARRLGIDRASLHRKIKKHELRKAE